MLLLSLLFYGYATGVRSSRKLAQRCISDHTYIYLMQSYTPDHRTISDFRKNNLKEIGKYFVDIVRIFSKLGYSHVGKIYTVSWVYRRIDGTKLKGNASAKRAKDRAGFEKWLSEIEEAVTDANDRNQLKPMVEQTESNTQEAVSVLENQNKSCPRVNGERPRAVNGIIKCTKGQSVGHVRNERYVPSQGYGNYSLIYENLF